VLDFVKATNATYILILLQVLYLKDMMHNPIAPFQLQANGIFVNDIPISTFMHHMPLVEIPADSHSIVIPDHQVLIPLDLNGFMSYFSTRRPTAYELDHPELFPQISMTLDSPYGTLTMNTLPKWSPNVE
jgi:hypothetical protein